MNTDPAVVIRLAVAAAGSVLLLLGSLGINVPVLDENATAEALINLASLVAIGWAVYKDNPTSAASKMLNVVLKRLKKEGITSAEKSVIAELAHGNTLPGNALLCDPPANPEIEGTEGFPGGEE